MLADVQRIIGDPGYIPTDPQELAGKIFTTCYMGTENSSAETRTRAAQLAKQVGRFVSRLLATFFKLQDSNKTLAGLKAAIDGEDIMNLLSLR